MFTILPSYAHYSVSGSSTNHDDGINLSGRLYTTGSSLYNTITSISGKYNGRSIMMCSALTPSYIGADGGEIPIPYDIDGTGIINWSVRRITLRVQTAGGSPSITVEKSPGTGGFVASTLGTVTLPNNAYEASVINSGTVASTDKIRFNVGTLGTAQNWTIITEISNP
jgi:hypothetical protein